MARKGTRGNLKPRGEWGKLKPFWRKSFWGRERMATKQEIRKES